ncbi:Protein of unknown function [Paraburkholderia phenazinium]|uniref:DUF2591 domain-containing protein n=1 Tax=Paraburkholderia phenazinium TaxID=60549 RepID=A0A1G7ZIC2_9BURK|nr:phage protein NinX family protein [Paraburkholderia phenazinium]SDH08473.1 Protein of unknown function [Paraburkholderia phenazinium]
MRVTELEGDTLDLWVAKAWMARSTYATVDASYVRDYDFHPSTDWAQGGPILEREHLTLEAGNHYGGGNTYKAWLRNPDGFFHAYGPTLLIAAMRAYVCSIFGEEVEDSAIKPSAEGKTDHWVDGGYDQKIDDFLRAK